jgi:hypothetical protein
MKIKSMLRFHCFATLQFLSLSLFAATPVWTITPLTPINFTVTEDSTVSVQYQVTNQSKLTHTLAMQPVAGINQITSNGSCANPFTLAYHQSCILKLQIQGSALQGNVSDAPIICESGGTLLCYQPSGPNRLSITLVKKINLTIANSPLSLTVGSGSGNVTITNPSSTLTVTNLQADFTGTALAGNVIQNASNCLSLAPGQTCTLTFTPVSNAVTLTSFPIVGGNANPVAGQIQIIAPTIATITVTGSPLTLQGTNRTPVPGSLTVTNQSNTLTAVNIAANISGALASGGVVQNSSGCNSLPPLQTCNLVFSPGSQAVSNSNVSIQGGNTSVVSANISVNAPPQAAITVSAGSPLTLYTGGATGTLTIQNNSTTENALNIVSNFTSTALNGLVSQTGTTCSSVAPGGTCTLTYTPGVVAVVQTNFPIQGSNTSSATGAIQILVPVAIIYNTTANYTGNLGGLSGANSICNSDPNKPSTGFAAAYTYKAMLNGNNATTSGVTYYRTDGVTVITTANGGNLIGAATLSNAVTGTFRYVWTGANGNSCSNWSNGTNSFNGDIGESSTILGTYWSYGTSQCQIGNSLYCVSQ